MTKRVRYNIIWQECGADSQTAERFFVPGFAGHLPFFVDGEELEALEREEKLELREEHLLKGILYGLYDLEHHPEPRHRPEERDTLCYLLEVLRDGFRFDSLETMILDVACSVRENNGHRASRIILEVGNTLAGQSAKIKSDLIFDLWALAAEPAEHAKEAARFEQISRLVEQIDLTAIQAAGREIVCYYGLCALVLLRDQEAVDRYLPRYIYPNVTSPQLVHNIKALLERPEAFRPAELKIG
ncbi:hypothetical protein [Desulfogranum mediterraneum]|uniref:hypothetical protein n=1 Tax=Desulfogranum mediterraneum TaxID=160661 RepID=UPI0003FD3D39|nr:hypothetical protein [Desulfogranum mediterraneum]